MDAKVKKILIVSAIVLASAVLEFFCGYGVGYHTCSKKYQKDIKEIESAISGLEHQRDSLQSLVQVLDNSIGDLTDSLSNQKEKIVYIKVTSNEKIDSIRNLPLDDAVMFLSGELSKEAGSER